MRYYLDCFASRVTLALLTAALVVPSEAQVRSPQQLEGFAKKVEAQQIKLERHHQNHGKGGVGRVFHRALLLGRDDCEVTIREEIPKEFRHGVLANPGTYRAIVRFSNGQGSEIDRDGDEIPDASPDVRGLAFKFFTPEGRAVDFLATNTTSSFAEVVPTFLKVAEFLHKSAIEGKGRVSLRVLAGSFRGEFNLLKAGRIARKITFQTVFTPDSLATEEFWGSTFTLPGCPLCRRPFVVRYVIKPDENTTQGTMGSGDHFLKDDLKARLEEADLKYTVCLAVHTGGHLAADEEFENPRIVEIADLCIPQSNSEQGAFVESVAFNPANFLGLTTVDEVMKDPNQDPEIAGMQGRWRAYLASAQGRGAISDEEIWINRIREKQ